MEHGVDQMRVVGGVCGCCLREAMQFYMGSSCADVGTARGIDHGSRSIENLGDPFTSCIKYRNSRDNKDCRKCT